MNITDLHVTLTLHPATLRVIEENADWLAEQLLDFAHDDQRCSHEIALTLWLSDPVSLGATRLTALAEIVEQVQARIREHGADATPAGEDEKLIARTLIHAAHDDIQFLWENDENASHDGQPFPFDEVGEDFRCLHTLWEMDASWA